MEPGNPQAIAAAVRLLVTNDDRWAAMSVEARRSYEHRYRVEPWAKDVREILLESGDAR